MERLRFNIVIIGDPFVGKSSILTRFFKRQFNQLQLETIGVELRQVQWTSSSLDECLVRVWDTAGQERFRSLAPSFFKNADGIIVVFDLTRQESLEGVRDCLV